MYLEEKNNEAPIIKRIEVEFLGRFKAKYGKIELYHKESEKAVGFDKLEIIAIADSRFTVEQPNLEKGTSVWSGLYKDSRQVITMMQKKDNKVSILTSGTWEQLKPQGFKYTKVLHCLVKVNNKWSTCEFKFQGISAIMWGDIKDKGTDRVILLSVSPTKDFKTPMGMFYTMQGGAVSDIKEEADVTAKEFALDVKDSYNSHDENYDYYANITPKESVSEESEEEKEAQREINDAVEEQKEVNIEDVPF